MALCPFRSWRAELRAARVRVTSRAWWRQAAAMLRAPVSFRIAMARLQGGHDLRAVAGADLRGVLAVTDVEDVVQHLPTRRAGQRGINRTHATMARPWTRTPDLCDAGKLARR